MNAVTPSETAAPASIVERIAAAVRDPASTSASLRTLWDEAHALRSGMGEAEAASMKQALDPANSIAEARAARHSAEDFAHEGRRLEAALASIDNALPGIRSAEHQAATRPAYEEHKAKRAALVERIRKEWPTLTAKMIDLLDAIEAFRQAPGVEIPEGEDPLRIDVEAEARGCDSSFYAPPYPGAGVAPLKRLRDSQIVRFQPSAREDERMAWPRYRRQIG